MFIAELTLDVFLRGLVLTSLAMVWIVMIMCMTNFNFVMTVAVGSLLAGASQSTNWSAFAQPLSAMAALFLAQYLSTRLRIVSNTFETLLQNSPVLLMRDGVIRAVLTKTRVAKNDLITKLREVNALDLSKICAVMMETTGDISVLHGDVCAEKLLQGTKRID